MAGIHITDIESAINYWRGKSPSPDGVSLPGPTRALAEIYALLVYYGEAEADERSMPRAAHEAWTAWYDSTPDTPCIAICSTSQGDETCKGCGRSFSEVQHWPQMSPAEKRGTWRRITLDGSAWRFNRYAERAAEGARPASDARDAQTSSPSIWAMASALRQRREPNMVVTQADPRQNAKVDCLAVGAVSTTQ